MTGPVRTESFLHGPVWLPIPSVGTRPALGARPVRLVPSCLGVNLNRLISKCRGLAVNPDQKYKQMYGFDNSHSNVPGAAKMSGFITVSPLGLATLPWLLLRLQLRGPVAACCRGLRNVRTGWWPCSFLPCSWVDLLPIALRLRGSRLLLRWRLGTPPPGPAPLPVRSRSCLWIGPLFWGHLSGCRCWPLSLPPLASANWK